MLAEKITSGLLENQIFDLKNGIKCLPAKCLEISILHVMGTLNIENLF